MMRTVQESDGLRPFNRQRTRMWSKQDEISLWGRSDAVKVDGEMCDLFGERGQ